jgi:hypothetical protein
MQDLLLLGALSIGLASEWGVFSNSVYAAPPRLFPINGYGEPRDNWTQTSFGGISTHLGLHTTTKAFQNSIGCKLTNGAKMILPRCPPLRVHESVDSDSFAE